MKAILAFKKQANSLAQPPKLFFDGQFQYKKTPPFWTDFQPVSSRHNRRYFFLVFAASEGKREVSEKRQTSATAKTQKNQRPVHTPSFCCGAPHALLAHIRSSFGLAFARLKNARLLCRLASQHDMGMAEKEICNTRLLIWAYTNLEAFLAHSQKPKFGRLFRTYIDLSLPLSFFPLPFFFCCSVA